MELIMIRHGETEWSRTGQHTGSTDLPLLEVGRIQAASLRPLIERSLDGRTFSGIYSSPLQRARETAAISRPGESVAVSELLREYTYGDYEGLTPHEIRTRVPGWDIWRDGCPNGETTEQVGARADEFLARHAHVEGPIAVFSHGHMLRILGTRALGLPATQGHIFTLGTASVSVVKDYHGKRVISIWNLTGSLVSDPQIGSRSR